jgi:6-phosphogluconolactonase
MGTRPLMETTVTGHSVSVLPDARSLALAAATVIAAEARRAVDETGRFTIVLAGGNTPSPVYELLSASPFADLVPWPQTHVFWGDERCVDLADPRSNERMARETLLDHVPIPAGQVHPMRCTGLEGTGAEASAGAGGIPVAHGETVARRVAAEYEAFLRGFFGAGGAAAEGAVAGSPGDGPRAPVGVDLVILGIGDNGHTASLFPGSEVLAERERWVAASLEDPATAAATSNTGERLWRVTLTAPFINRAALVLFVVSGVSKALAVKGTIEGEADPRGLPARLIRPLNGRLWWLLDRDAASRLDLAGPAGVPAAVDDDAGSFEDLSGCDLGPSR